MNRAAKTLVRALPIAALTLSGLAVAAPAHAVTCYGDYCSGLDPQSSGCAADAYTATSYGNNLFMMEVRYSPTCKTNWTRITMYNSGYKCSPNGTLSSVQDSGYTQSTYIDSVCPGPSFTRWTPMIYSPVRKVQGRFSGSAGSFVTPWA